MPFPETQLSAEQLVDDVWELTKPPDPYQAAIYRESLSIILQNPHMIDHYSPFYVPKPNGEHRIIFHANREMSIVQGALTYWITHNFNLGEDYCYSGQGVLPAVQAHELAVYAVVFDFDNAFESVTTEALTEELKQQDTTAPQYIFETIAQLLTVDGRLRQGCVSSPYAYNVVARTIDADLRNRIPLLQSATYTRYSDNCCISSTEYFDVEEVLSTVEEVLTEHEFRLSWANIYPMTPIEYLGTTIYHGELSLAPEKLNTIVEKLYEAIYNPNPALYRASIVGIYTWSRRIFGKEIPTYLLDPLEKYFSRYGVGGPPHTLLDLLAERKHDRLFD